MNLQLCLNSNTLKDTLKGYEFILKVKNDGFETYEGRTRESKGIVFLDSDSVFQPVKKKRINRP